MQCIDRVAVVTGAAGQGMGRSIALTLAREGAQVVANYRTSREQAEELVGSLTAQGCCAIAVQADIFSAEGCQQLVEATLARFGRIDICVIGPGADWHPEPIDRLNAGGALSDLQQEVAPLMHLMPLVLPGMYERQWGRLIGLVLHPTKLPPAYAYNAAKAARLEALRLTSDQAWAHRVTANMVAPGPISPIPTLAEAVEQCAHGPAWQVRSGVSPQDVAEGVAFLCSDAARYVSGAILPYLF
jgi:3-oxoacyl-[acyl-carrier protein] reductase